MSKLFPNYTINLEKGTVYSNKHNKYIGSYNNGYYECKIKDTYNNMYTKIHQIIIAEGLQLPKHKWPLDENGNRFETDHIIPISNGGTDAFSNLRLVSKKDNSNNKTTKINQSNARKGIIITEEWRKKLSEAQKLAFKEGRRTKEQLKKFIEACKKISEESKETIYQYSLDGELVAVYNGRNTAERETGFNRERISFHCNDGKPYKGFIWSKKELHGIV